MFTNCGSFNEGAVVSGNVDETGDHLICMPLNLMSIVSDYVCLINVSTNHSPFVEAAAVSEYQ